MTVKSGTRPSCALCKYQRRKCSSVCMLAPYFPENQPKMFQNVHKLFGVCNIVKILKQLDDNDQKADAMRSIIFEADTWEKFPVYGCLEYICHLRQQLQYALKELHYVYGQLAIYREQHQQQLASNNSTMVPFFTRNGEFCENLLAFPASDQRDTSQNYESLINPFNNITTDDNNLNINQGRG